jgi:hypothetical protein
LLQFKTAAGRIHCEALLNNLPETSKLRVLRYPQSIEVKMPESFFHAQVGVHMMDMVVDTLLLAMFVDGTKYIASGLLKTAGASAFNSSLMADIIGSTTKEGS